MPILLSFDESNGIVYTSREGEVTPQERLQAVKDLAEMNKRGSLLLVDGRNQTDFIYSAEVEDLFKLSTELGLDFRKVAIVEPEGFQPYILLVSDAFLMGRHIQEFKDIDEAEAWLLS